MNRHPAATKLRDVLANSTRATVALTKAQIPFSVHRYAYDKTAASIGRQAADALGVSAGMVFKTLMLLVDRAPCSAILPSDNELSMKRVAAAFGAKSAEMMMPDMAERLTGYKIGGISPLGQSKSVPTLLDEAALLYDAIYINGGQRGLQILLSPHDLVTLVTKVAPITA